MRPISSPPRRGEIHMLQIPWSFLLCHHHWFWHTQISRWWKAVQNLNIRKSIGNIAMLKQKNEDSWAKLEPPPYLKTMVQKTRLQALQWLCLINYTASFKNLKSSIFICTIDRNRDVMKHTVMRSVFRFITSVFLSYDHFNDYFDN